MTNNEAIKILEERYLTMSMCGDIEQCKRNNQAISLAVTALQEIQQYRAIGTVEECLEAREIKQKITEMVNQQLIAGKDNYKEIYSCFYEIVRIIQNHY